MYRFVKKMLSEGVVTDFRLTLVLNSVQIYTQMSLLVQKTRVSASHLYEIFHLRKFLGFERQDAFPSQSNFPTLCS
jgi:hypothetical protein